LPLTVIGARRSFQIQGKQSADKQSVRGADVHRRAGVAGTSGKTANEGMKASGSNYWLNR